MSRQVMYDGSEYFAPEDNNSYAQFNVTHIRKVTVAPSSTGSGYSVFLNFDGSDYNSRDFANEADAIAEAEVWVARIESA